MSRTDSDSNHLPIFERSLTRRVRPPQIANELRKLQGLGSAAIRRRATENDKAQQLSFEAMVSVLRAYLLVGNKAEADEVFIALICRLSGSIANKLVKWRSLSGEQADDARQTVILGLYEYFASLDASEELWECNFKTCFDTRLLTIFGKMTRGVLTTVSMDQTDRDGDESFDKFDTPDPGAEAEFLTVEVEEALHHLDRLDSRLSKVFYLKYFSELTEKEISNLMEVSERTVRNWIGVSKIELRRYFA